MGHGRRPRQVLSRNPGRKARASFPARTEPSPSVVGPVAATRKISPRPRGSRGFSGLSNRELRNQSRVTGRSWTNSIVDKNTGRDLNLAIQKFTRKSYFGVLFHRGPRGEAEPIPRTKNPGLTVPARNSGYSQEMEKRRGKHHCNGFKNIFAVFRTFPNPAFCFMTYRPCWPIRRLGGSPWSEWPGL